MNIHQIESNKGSLTPDAFGTKPKASHAQLLWGGNVNWRTPSWRREMPTFCHGSQLNIIVFPVIFIQFAMLTGNLTCFLTTKYLNTRNLLKLNTSMPTYAKRKKLKYRTLSYITKGKLIWKPIVGSTSSRHIGYEVQHSLSIVGHCYCEFSEVKCKHTAT